MSKKDETHKYRRDNFYNIPEDEKEELLFSNLPKDAQMDFLKIVAEYVGEVLAGKVKINESKN